MAAQRTRIVQTNWSRTDHGYQVGTRIGYAKVYLRQTATPATDASWRRQGTIVALGGTVSPMYPHWRTGEPSRIPEDRVLIHWDDRAYPYAHDPDDPASEMVHADATHPSAVARIGSGRFAEEIP